MIHLSILFCAIEKDQVLQPAVIAAIIGALVALPGFILNFQNSRLQRKKSERDEIYKKLLN